MAPAHDPVFETALLDLMALSIGLAPDRLVSTDLLGELDISINDFLVLVAALEDHCQVVLPDCELARCGTLGDLIDRLRARSILDAVLALDGRSDQPADAGRHDHGQRAPKVTLAAACQGGAPPAFALAMPSSARQARAIDIAPAQPADRDQMRGSAA